MYAGSLARCSMMIRIRAAPLAAAHSGEVAFIGGSDGSK